MPTNLDFRREYAGAAGDQLLVADITSSVLSLTVDGTTGWPTGTHPFVITIDPDGSTEEKVLCSTRSGNTLTVSQRGYDGTSAFAHSAGQKVRHTESAADFDAFNLHASSTAGVHGLDGNIVDDSTAQTLTNKTLVQPAISDLSYAQHDHSSATQGGVLPLMHSGTSTWTGSASSFAVFNHGASFTPTTAVVLITATNAGGNYDAHVYGAPNATSMIVAWTAQGNAAGTNLTSVTIQYTVFA